MTEFDIYCFFKTKYVDKTVFFCYNYIRLKHIIGEKNEIYGNCKKN